MNLIDLFNNVQSRLDSGVPLKDCQHLLKLYKDDDYKNYVCYRNDKYNRVVIKFNPKIELVLICWGKNQQSGFHGHPGECIFKVLNNTITESLKKGDETTTINQYKMGDTGYIDNLIGTHNMYTDSHCVTLHIYSPPIHNTIG